MLTKKQIIDESGGIGLKQSLAIQDISTFHNISNFIIKKQNLIN